MRSMRISERRRFGVSSPAKFKTIRSGAQRLTCADATGLTVLSFAREPDDSARDARQDAARIFLRDIDHILFSDFVIARAVS
jgi:hypothetical protein